MMDAEDLFSAACAGGSLALLNPLSLFLSDSVPWKIESWCCELPCPSGVYWGLDNSHWCEAEKKKESEVGLPVPRSLLA